MNLILLISSLIVLLFFLYSQYLKYKRFEHINNMCRVYGKMEMHFIENNIILKNDYIEFLKIFKNLCVNPDYLDIQVLVLTKIASEKKGSIEDSSEWFENVLKALGDEYKILFDEFDFHSKKVVKLSFFRPDFIWFLTKMVISVLIYSGFKSLFNIKKDFEYAQENDEILTYTGMNLC